MKRYKLLVVLFAVLLLTACGKKDNEESKTVTFDSLATDQISLIALGNSEVPVGQYSQEILENLGIWDQIQDKISFGSNVKEVLSQVEEGSVDCGIVYATDAAASEGVKVAAKAPDGSLKTPVVYPAAMLTEAANKEGAKAFLAYLSSDTAAAEFEKAGFSFIGTNTAVNTNADAKDIGGTVTVFAAASLTESLTAIKDSFEAAYPGTKIVCNFDSSGTLQTQLEEGADADIFFSAAQKQMNALEDEDMISSETRQDLLKNEVVLIVPAE